MWANNIQYVNKDSNHQSNIYVPPPCFWTTTQKHGRNALLDTNLMTWINLTESWNCYLCAVLSWTFVEPWFIVLSHLFIMLSLLSLLMLWYLVCPLSRLVSLSVSLESLSKLSLTLCCLGLRGTLEVLCPASRGAGMSWLVWWVGESVVDEPEDQESTQKSNNTLSGCLTSWVSFPDDVHLSV